MEPILDLQAYMGELKAWGEVSESLRTRNRFIVRDRAFIERVLKTAENSTSELPAGSSFFRARKLPFGRARANKFSREEMGAPPAINASSGRLNPAGIPCLYVADHEETAIAEIRPSRGAIVCVGTLSNPKPHVVVDLMKSHALGATDATIRCLSRMLAQPIHQDDSLGYLATQYLAESLKDAGFAGIRYESSLRTQGWNVAFFDATAAEVMDVRMFTVESVAYSVTQRTDTVDQLLALFAPGT